jgi:hypothetical protein
LGCLAWAVLLARCLELGGAWRSWRHLGRTRVRGGGVDLVVWLTTTSRGHPPRCRLMYRQATLSCCSCIAASLTSSRQDNGGLSRIRTMETEDTADDAALGTKILRSHLGSSTTLISASVGVVTSLGGASCSSLPKIRLGTSSPRCSATCWCSRGGRDTAQPESGCIAGVTSWP